ncbi:DMT family transporter [Echinicola soli]|uniref:DMT family transporter n=1 Tax=Echinicola soli TaxID=2591634 RepID=A0A514CHD0_9BACT|nr:DMT family transporter [Echinicola soli]QDH79216.1 DMT family transporter [Echinicola soli]
MKTIIIYLMAFTGGVSLAIQAGFNAQLGAFLKQPLYAVLASSVFSVLFATVFVLATEKEIPTQINLQHIPWYLWGIGGLFSVVGISLYFYTIPQLGIFKMITMGLCGQLIFSVIAGRFGWLNLPLEVITTKKIIGIISLILSIILINSK